MFHGPKGEPKQQTEAGRPAVAPEPQREQHPRMVGRNSAESAGISTFGVWSNAAPVRQHFAGLQQTIGNQAVLRMLSQSGPVVQPKPVLRMLNRSPESQQAAPSSASGPVVQGKCACGGYAGECESCKEEREQGTVQRNTASTSGRSGVPPIVDEVLRSPGHPLDAETRAFFEPRFGQDFGEVRIHSDNRAADSARSVNALAYTSGQDVVFGAQQYAPRTSTGLYLLAHELTHTLQQQGGRSSREPRVISAPGDDAEREASRAAGIVLGGNNFVGQRIAASPIRSSSEPPSIQRELMAYKAEHTELLPTSPDSPFTTYQNYTADSTNVLSALQNLLSASKVGARDAGDRTFFFNRGASRAEILLAFGAAGYSKSQEMADALMDEHNVSVYSREQVTKMSGLFTMTLGTQKQLIERQTERPLTDAERIEAQLVFGTSLNFDQITVTEDPVLGSFDYARTLPRSVNFPPGSFGSPNFIPWLIHELTHSWQYQHGVSLFTTIYHALRANYDYNGEAGLIAALKEGRGFTSFNTEQQGDILRDYYIRLKSDQDVSAWSPFVNEVRGVVSSPRGDFPIPVRGSVLS